MGFLFGSTDKSDKPKVIFSYRGHLTARQYDDLFFLIESKILEFVPKKSLQRKIQVIIIELLQNVRQNMEVNLKARVDGFAFLDFLIVKKGKTIEIMCGNLALPIEVQTAVKRIEIVNRLTKEQLVQAYREILGNGKFTARGGAGLGIYDVKRKSGQNIQYQVKPTKNQETLFLKLLVTVSIK
ncbi:DUF6272 family protein [Rapidithrix thailandica]|uniref:DUF6272 family protein n=1 Tax=Rapidithrix thailandica TaxID=413964 RepID=A0AAW9RY64_9BACT